MVFSRQHLTVAKTWAEGDAFFQDGQRQMWTLTATDRVREGTLVLLNLKDFYTAQGIQRSDRIHLTTTAMGIANVDIIHCKMKG